MLLMVLVGDTGVYWLSGKVERKALANVSLNILRENTAYRERSYIRIPKGPLCAFGRCRCGQRRRRGREWAERRRRRGSIGQDGRVRAHIGRAPAPLG